MTNACKSETKDEVNNAVNASIKETIDANIEDIKD